MHFPSPALELVIRSDGTQVEKTLPNPLSLVYVARVRSFERKKPVPILPTLQSICTPHQRPLYDWFLVIIDFITALDIIATFTTSSIQPTAKSATTATIAQSKSTKIENPKAMKRQTSDDNGLCQD